jgi:hypothetical protein
MPSSALRFLTSRLTVGTYFALILLPVLLLGYDGPWFGPGDIAIRGRAPFPAKFAPGAFSAFDLWFADRIGFRYPLIYAGTNFHIGLLHRPLDRHIVFGREGWMYWTDDRDTAPATMADARGRLRFTAMEARRINAQLKAAHDRFSACGIPSAVFIAPNKQSIYGEFLVSGAGGAVATRLDALIEALHGPAKQMLIDPRPIMRAAKRAHAPLRLYNKTESHWNELGAYYGYRALIQLIEQVMPLPHPELKSLDNYQVVAGPYPGGDMATRVLFSPWRFADENVTVRPKQPILGELEVQVDRLHFVSRNANGSGRIVLFGDSFAMYLVPFLLQHFGEVHRYAGAQFDGAVVGLHDPDIVVLETLESYAPRLLLPPINLDAACK